MPTHTRRPLPRRARLPVLLVAAGLTAALTACGGSNGSGSDPADGSAPISVAVDQKAANLVPKPVKDTGKLIVAVDPTFPPSGYYASGKKLVGADVELGAALGKALGLKTNSVAASFDSIIPGIQSGKYTAGMSLINITAAREKTLDLVEYFENGSSIMASADTPLSNSASLNDLCGHQVAVQRAAVQVDIAKQQSTKCTGAGHRAIKVKVFPDYNSATLAIANGRVDVGLFDQTNAAYTAKQSASKLKVVGQPVGQTPCGIAVRKDNGMAAAVQAALNGLIQHGIYKKILTKYGLQDGAVSTARVNPSA